MISQVGINSSLIVNEDIDDDDDGSTANTPITTRYSLAEDISNSEVFPAIKHKQAALLLQKGINNEKFASIAISKSSEVAYEIVHHPFYVWFNLLTAIGLLLLAIGENTFAQSESKLNYDSRCKIIIVHTAELILLLFLALNLIFRSVWAGPKPFIRSRSIIMAIIILVMIIEIIVILSRGYRHDRFLRALRPFLLLDTFLMSGVRRVLRQLFKCLKYIFDVLLILFFLITIFAIMAHFLFAKVEEMYFEDLGRSFVSILITFTTANHPDVFLEAYNKNSAAPLFFMVYMFVTFYYFSNVLLAVVFAKFKQAEKKKFKKLFLHRRKALKQAYNALKTDNGVRFVDFLCCLQQFKPGTTPHQALCLFLSIRQSNNNYSISWDEFSNLYDYIQLKWAQTHDNGLEVSWYTNKKWLSRKTRNAMKYIHRVLEHWLFDSVMGIIVLINLALLIFSITFRENDCKDNKFNKTMSNDQFCSMQYDWSLAISFVFIIIYIIEIMLRIFFNGPVRYFRKRWNTVDFILVMGCFICLIIESVLIKHSDPEYFRDHNLRYFAIARPLVLLRLLKLRRSYFYLLRIMLVLAERLISVFFLLIIVYYIYAIIGMEVFSGNNQTVFANCCQDSLYGLSAYYDNVSNTDGFFFTSTFESLWSSYVTLYELMVVNNWFIIMEGFVTTTSDAARAFFILFWITTTLVVNVAIVYIVDAFESGLLALQIQEDISNNSNGGSVDTSRDHELQNRGGDLKRVIHLEITHDDVDAMEQSARVVTVHYGIKDLLSMNVLMSKCKSLFASNTKKLNGEFRGHRIMNNDDLRQYLYSSDVDVWKEEFEQQSYEESFRDPSSSSGSYRDIGLEFMMYLWKTTKKVGYYLLG